MRRTADTLQAMAHDSQEGTVDPANQHLKGDIQMKPFAITAGALLAVLAFSGVLHAGDWGYGHARYHDELEHREYHRHLEHRDAHRYPMTWRQHSRLHDSLDHDRYHDHLEHRDYHRSYRRHYGYGSYYGHPYWGRSYYSYPAAGYGFGGNNFSIWIGH